MRARTLPVLVAALALLPAAAPATAHAAAATPTPTASPTATSTPTPTPAATATPAPTVESGQLPPSATGESGAGAVPPAGAVTPVPSATPVPTAPPVAPAAQAATPAPPVVTHTGHRSVLLPAVLIALALAGAAVLAVSTLAGRRSPGVRHAWREAAFRTRGTWADFSDWLRLGR
jgi:hypothetical protein